MILPIMFVIEVKQLLMQCKKKIKIFSQNKVYYYTNHYIFITSKRLVDVQILMVQYKTLLNKYLKCKMSQMPIPSTSGYMYNYIIFI